ARDLKARFLLLGYRRRGLDRARKREVMGEEFLLERNIIALESRDLRLKRGSLVRDGLACPSNRPARAQRHLAGTPIQAQITVICPVEGVTPIIAFCCAVLRPCCLCGAKAQDRQCYSRADHIPSPAGLRHKRSRCEGTMPRKG